MRTFYKYHGALSIHPARIKRENEAEAIEAKARDDAEKEALIQRQREQRQFFIQRETQKREKLVQQHRDVSTERAEFERRSDPAQDTELEAFKRSRRRENAAVHRSRIDRSEP